MNRQHRPMMVLVVLAAAVTITLGLLWAAQPANAEHSGRVRSTMITKWIGGGFPKRGVVLDNGALSALIFAGKCDDLNGMMPVEFRFRGRDNLIQVGRNHVMYLRYPGADIGKKLRPTSTEVISDDDNRSTLRQVWRHKDYKLTSFVTIVAGEPALYYDFEMESLRDFGSLTAVAAISSKFNFNRFAVGEPTAEFASGTRRFSDRAAAWSDVRGEGILLVVNGPGAFELQAGEVSWVNKRYRGGRYGEGTKGNLWQMKCEFLMDKFRRGTKRRFGWRLSHLGQYADALNPQRRKARGQTTFFDVDGQAVPLTLVAPRTKPVSDPCDVQWAKARAEQHGVIKVAHFTSMPVGEWGMEEGHPWKLPFLTYKHFKDGIDRALSFGFNTICIWDGTYAMVDDDVKKRAIRYAHSKGLKVWYMVSRPYGSCTFPYYFDDARNSMPLIRSAIDKFCSAELGDEAVDCFGWDWEEVPSPFFRGYGYHDGLIRADEELLKLYSKKLGKEMIKSSLEEIRRGYARLWGQWFGEVHKYLKLKNKDCQFFILGTWYEKHLARAITSNCPGIHVSVLVGPEKAVELNEHGVRAWHNAGAHVSVLHREPYLSVGIVDRAVRGAMMAGADGLFFFDFALRSEAIARAYVKAMNEYFPGNLSRPLARYTINPELPEYDKGGLCFENVGDPASVGGQ